ncbi:amino acid adenylation domain-containing protein [Kordia periserrulae]|uniref:Amino acid adenylation domain-containing protein n=1 Tax=Kordia periserrulae TaxID=701523 RepID=A0A2T6BZ74_9FLAO|nr:non-ribosomal peptide synthetase/type I polyketide synthase [Kordia periserrulae]PTX61369.1 amino acid adenylation domain-containing protein [Kordia periserrulae]
MISWLNRLAKQGIFFKLKDGELKVLTKQKNIDTALLKEIKSKKEQITAYLVQQKSLEEKEAYSPIPKAPQQESYPLSNGQKRLYIASQLEEKSTAYNIPTDIFLSTEYDVAILEKSIIEVVKRHESLRTIFKKNNEGKVSQWIVPFEQLTFSVDYKDFRNSEEPAKAVQKFLEEYKKESFDLGKGPLFRFSIINFSDEMNILHFNIHHIISDEWSEEILKRDILEFYESFVHNRTPNLPELKIQYKDFTLWKEANKDTATYQKSKDFWLQYFKGEIPKLELPLKNKRPITRTNDGEKVITYISPKITKNCNTFLKKEKGSLFALLFSVMKITFSKYIQEKELIIGTAVSGREHSDLENQVGFYVNTLAIKSNIESQESFLDFFKRTSENIKQVFAHQDYPFDSQVEDLKLNRDSSRNLLFDVSIVFHNHIKDSQIRQEDFESIEFIGKTLVKLDIEIAFTEVNDYIRLDISYYNKIYSKTTIEKFIHHFKNTLQLLMAKPKTLISEIDYLTKEEKTQLLKTFNETEVNYGLEETVLDILKTQVEATPNAIAVSLGEEKLSYEQLDILSNQFANYLIAKGIEKGTHIPISMERSLHTIIAIFGIIKSGGVYIPIDPNYPQQRIDFILEDIKATYVVTQSHLLEKFASYQENLQLIAIDTIFEEITQLQTETPKVTVQSEDAIYIIYTSGTTGKPKGVVCGHKGVLNLAQNQIEKMELTANDKTLQFASVSFDAFGFELYATLLSGGELVMVSESTIKSKDAISTIIADKNITVATLPPSYQVVLNTSLNSLRVIVSAGEALNIPQTKKLQAAGVKVINGYGPTENSVCTTMSLNPVYDETKATIGKPLNNVQVYILNEALEIVPVGVTGELCTSGAQLAKGYLNREALTAEKFIDHPFKKGEKLYKTGDLACWLPDGNLEFLGRKDDQVKIRGYRVELEEIEAQFLQINTVDEVAVVVKTFGNNQKQLLAFITSQTLTETTAVEEKVKEVLPEYMVPSQISIVEKMPLTTNGKIDKKALLKTLEATTNTNSISRNTNVENKILEIWGKLLHQEPSTIDKNTGFFQLGGNSLLIMEMHQEIKKAFSTDIQIANLFQNVTVASQVALLEKNNEADNTEIDDFKATRTRNEQNSDVAVIGMAIKTPGAANVSEFWDNLKNGEEPLTYFTDEQLLKLGISQQTLENENYVKAGFFMDGKENFDAAFFDYLPDEAKLMDPQTRMLHELVWEGLEDAGYDPHVYEGAIGLYAGLRANVNWEIYSTLINENQNVNSFTAAQLQSKEFATTLIAYKLNLKGGVYVLNTACSTSLVAIHRAVDSLLSGENNIALAGGVSIKKNFDRGYFYQEGMINSKDAHNKAFDNDSNGTVESEGAGIVVLKRLEDAKRDGDNILAVIKGSAINNDGSRKVGYTAPSIDGQIEVIQKAQQVAQVAPETISYIEAHGTATRLGDTVEFEALSKVFKNSNTKHCALGTVKSNLGHMDTAAGVGGFIKTVLSLQHKKLVPSLHFKKPNTNLNYHESPFYVNTEFKDWEAQDQNLLRAGVSSFGIGGTNAHVIVEEFVTEEKEVPTKKKELIVLSAKTQDALQRQKENLLEFVSKNEQTSLANIAYTLQTARRAFPQRAALVADSISDLKDKLQQPNHAAYGTVKDSTKSIVFMFPGQGSQYLNMGRDLYEVGGVFTKVLDNCFTIVQEQHGIHLKQLLFTEANDASIINQTKNTQPLLFCIEYALAKQLQHLGIHPDLMIGHSIGEYVATCVSGVLSLKDALSLVVKRGEMIQALPKGTMISIDLSAEEVAPFLNPAIDIAAINTQNGCVLSGTHENIEQFKAQLDDFEVNYKDLHTSHAFHSQMMLPIQETFTEVIAQIERNAPKIPYISNITGKEITEANVKDDDYWFNHIRKTVRFADGLKTMFAATQDLICIEVGPGKTLSNFVRQNQPEKDATTQTVNLLRHPKEVKNDAEYFLENIGKLWTKGAKIDWKQVHGTTLPKKISLPTYPFAKIKYPIGENLQTMIAERMKLSNSAREIDSSKWFYQSTWQSNTLVSTDNYKTAETTLVFMDIYGYADAVVKGFEDKEHLIQVFKGTEFKQLSAKEFIVNPYYENDYQKLLETLVALKTIPSNIISLWQIDEGESKISNQDRNYVDYYTTLYLTKAVIRHVDTKIRLTIIANNTSQIIGYETVEAEKAMLKNVLLVTSQEQPNITTQCIDIHSSEAMKEISASILKEIKAQTKEMFVGYRFNKRWIQTYENISLQKPEKKALNIRENGIYLITGGLGSLGSVYAEYLLSNYQVSLVLIGRSALAENAEKQRQLKKLTALGKVTYTQADVCNEEEFTNLISELEATLGPINGIINSVGNVSNDAIKPVHLIDEETSQKHFKPKIIGTNVLTKVFKSHELDFCILTSSLSAIVGGKQTAAYAASNTYLDEISKAQVLKNTVSINYDGLNFNDETFAYGLNQQEAITVLEYALANTSLSQIIVSTGDVKERLKNSLEKTQQDTANAETNETQQLEINRTNLSSIYTAPTTETETALVELFTSFFGAKGIGIYDDFFELGGDSLKAMSLSNSIHKTFDVELGLKDFFEKPNIQALAQEIELLQEEKKKQEVVSNTKYEDII